MKKTLAFFMIFGITTCVVSNTMQASGKAVGEEKVEYLNDGIGPTLLLDVPKKRAKVPEIKDTGNRWEKKTERFEIEGKSARRYIGKLMSPEGKVVKEVSVESMREKIPLKYSEVPEKYKEMAELAEKEKVSIYKKKTWSYSMDLMSDNKFVAVIETYREMPPLIDFSSIKSSEQERKFSRWMGDLEIEGDICLFVCDSSGKEILKTRTKQYVDGYVLLNRGGKWILSVIGYESKIWEDYDLGGNFIGRRTE